LARSLDISFAHIFAVCNTNAQCPTGSTCVSGNCYPLCADNTCQPYPDVMTCQAGEWSHTDWVCHMSKWQVILL